MHKYMIVENGIILCIGIGTAGQSITDEQYNQILGLIRNKPAETDTIGYRLKTDLTWEQYEKETPAPYEDEPDALELLNILTGEAE